MYRCHQPTTGVNFELDINRKIGAEVDGKRSEGRGSLKVQDFLP